MNTPIVNISECIDAYATPLPIRRPISAESRRIVAESLAFGNLCVNYMVKYIGAGDLASGEGLNNVTFWSLFSMFLGHTAH